MPPLWPFRVAARIKAGGWIQFSRYRFVLAGLGAPERPGRAGFAAKPQAESAVKSGRRGLRCMMILSSEHGESSKVA